MASCIIPSKFIPYCSPAILADGDNFAIKIAETPAELEAAQRLRYDIFKSEQGRMGHMTQAVEGVDSDEYDQYCIHLVVLDKNRSNQIVGTYRVHPGVIAKTGIGFYSSSEYDIANIDDVAESLLEYGRSCVAADYRNGAVVSLLWSGISELHRRTKARYMLGCVSLETVDPVIGWAVYRHALGMCRAVESVVRGTPRPGYALPFPGEEAIDEFRRNHWDELLAHLPPLLKGYLRLGASLSGEPVLDADFGSIDFLIWLDIRNIPERYLRHFMNGIEI